MGMTAIEAGWVVTEVGRRPWTIYGLLRTAEVVTPMNGLVAPFALFTLLYVVLGFVTAVLLQRQVFAGSVVSRNRESVIENPPYGLQNLEIQSEF